MTQLWHDAMVIGDVRRGLCVDLVARLRIVTSSEVGSTDAAERLTK